MALKLKKRNSIMMQVIPNVNHCLVAKIHHTRSKRVGNDVTLPNQHCMEHKTSWLIITKSLYSEESTYRIPTIVNSVTIMGSRKHKINTQ